MIYKRIQNDKSIDDSKTVLYATDIGYGSYKIIYIVKQPTGQVLGHDQFLIGQKIYPFQECVFDITKEEEIMLDKLLTFQ